MTGYYFLSSSLPQLSLTAECDLEWPEFAFLLENNLSSKDLEKVHAVRRLYDLDNLRHFWLEEPFDRFGNYSENDLEDAILTREGLPEYVYSFIEDYDTTEKRLKAFPELTVRYFQEEIKQASGFLLDYLELERSIRLVLVGVRAKMMQRDLLYEMQFEDPLDDFVQQIIAQKDAKAFEPPYGFEDLSPIVHTHKDNPTELHKGLLEYRMKRLDAHYEINLFSLDRILGYLAQYILIQKWQALDEGQGLSIIDNTVKEIT